MTLNVKNVNLKILELLPKNLVKRTDLFIKSDFMIKFILVEYKN